MASPKELQEIVAARAAWRDRPAALVTVVKTSGSTYRKPGARMLVDDAGRSVGSISGGCLEDDARAQAIAVIASGQPALVSYDTTPDGDIVFGSGLGCQGIVHVLIEPLSAPGAVDDGLACLAHALDARRAGLLASVFAVDPPDTTGRSPVGAYRWFEEASTPGERTQPLAGHDLGLDPAELWRDAREALRRGRPVARVYHRRADGARVELLLDVIRPPRALLICGAGDDARPLARLGKEMGWRVRVADGRRAYATDARFPGVDELLVCPAPEFAARVAVEPGEAVVLMTHHFLHDQNYLGALLDSPAGYLGVLGPRRRTERLLAELARTGAAGRGALGKRSLRRLHGPAGLDIGAEAPEQIALAIVAEIEAVGARRRGGVLRLRRAPLHEPPAAPPRRDMELAV